MAVVRGTSSARIASSSSVSSSLAARPEKSKGAISCSITGVDSPLQRAESLTKFAIRYSARGWYGLSLVRNQ